MNQAFKDAVMNGFDQEYQTCMALIIDEKSKSVSLFLDTSRAVYLEWIEGEGGDIGLLRDAVTGKVVGIDLPLIDNKLSVRHEGPIRINSGFKKDDAS